MGSDEIGRARLQIAEDLARIDSARESLAKQLAEVDARTVLPHYCHVCGRKTREKE